MGKKKANKGKKKEELKKLTAPQRKCDSCEIAEGSMICAGCRQVRKILFKACEVQTMHLAIN